MAGGGPASRAGSAAKGASAGGKKPRSGGGARKKQPPGGTILGLSEVDTNDVAEEGEFDANPFAWKEPSMADVAQFRQRERERRLEKQRQQSKLKVYEKGVTRPPRAAADAGDDVASENAMVSILDLAAQQDTKTQQLAILTRDRHIEKEDLSDYIQKKRDMFLVQYALDVKRQEMKKMEGTAKAEAAKVLDLEIQLEADAGRFYEFLKENDATSAAAVKHAEELQKRRVELSGEVKKAESEQTALSSAIAKNEDRLQELSVYRDFLTGLAPKEWRDSQVRLDARGGGGGGGGGEGDGEGAGARGERRSANYFTTPEEVLTVFSELEAHNLSLITTGQETEEMLQDIEDRVTEEVAAMDAAQRKLEAQIETLDAQIQRDEDRAWFARERSSYFNSSQSSHELEKEMARLEDKVASVYSECIGENEASISALQMLTNVENKLEELFERMAKMPPDEVADAEKEKEKERRARAREEKVEAQRLHQESRIKKATERAAQAPKRQVGKKLVYRSAPPKQKKKSECQKKKTSEEEEEMRYYFQP